ncbi:MAG TPA: PhnD/SsuA/transferrin family substrate-binding protein, partial [Ktedonobacteraceae bacterium]|nr:PhnD/SsuA/transferrin family substrate-binding protein [Ktedonobacteraceae bacterium]
MKHPPLIFATFLSPVLYKTCLYITEYLEQLTGIPTFLLPGEDLDDFAAGAIDAGFISGLAYVHLTDRQPAPIEMAAVPVLYTQKDHYRHTPHALSDIVVRKSSPYTRVDDLQGCVWACTSKEHSAKPSYTDDQVAYETFFEQMTFKERIITCSHLQSLRLLLDGTVDAAIIHSRLLDEILEHSTKMNAQLRLIGSFNARTVPPVVI